MADIQLFNPLGDKKHAKFWAMVQMEMMLFSAIQQLGLWSRQQ